MEVVFGIDIVTICQLEHSELDENGSEAISNTFRGKASTREAFAVEYKPAVDEKQQTSFVVLGMDQHKPCFRILRPMSN